MAEVEAVPPAAAVEAAAAVADAVDDYKKPILREWPKKAGWSGHAPHHPFLTIVKINILIT